jgi:hypothetical protein
MGEKIAPIKSNNIIGANFPAAPDTMLRLAGGLRAAGQSWPNNPSYTLPYFLDSGNI